MPIKKNVIHSLAFSIAAALAVFLLPFLIMNDNDTEIAKMPITSISEKTNEKPFSITVMHRGNVISLTFFDYLCGVVAREMPADSEFEALKAQTVAAATYTIYRIQRSDKISFPGHGGAEICTDSAHCLAYISKEEFCKNEAASKSYSIIEDAVREVYGQAILHNGKPIDAVFFHSSCGVTSSAADAWGSDISYLQGVKSPYDKLDKDFARSVNLTLNEIKQKLTDAGLETEYYKNENDNIKIIKKDAFGTAIQIKIGKTVFRASAVRMALGLASTHIDISYKKGLFTFATKGYGHNVGLSQTGANYMARHGSSCREILKWYYTGVEIGYAY